MSEMVGLVLSGIVALSIVFIGIMYVAAPTRMVGSFGLRPPATDMNTLAWLRLKGIRDIASGVVVASVLLASSHRTLGVVILALGFIPLGDMTNIFCSGGNKATAIFVHGLTCVIMVASGLLLVGIL